MRKWLLRSRNLGAWDPHARPRAETSARRPLLWVNRLPAACFLAGIRRNLLWRGQKCLQQRNKLRSGNMRTRFRGFEPPSPQAVSPKKEPWPSPLTLCNPSQTTLGICQRGVGSFAAKTRLGISARGSRFAYAAQPPQVMAGGIGGSGFVDYQSKEPRPVTASSAMV